MEDLFFNINFSHCTDGKRTQIETLVIASNYVHRDDLAFVHLCVFKELE